jgi:hypothetical protein
MASMPFILCPNAHGFHVCEWQQFDVDKTGCKLCGYVHICHRDNCKLVETEDSLVCELTGLCIEEKLFRQDGYSDCIAYIGPVTTTESAFVPYDLVYDIVYEIICSERTKQSLLLDLKKITIKINVSLTAMDVSSGNIIQDMELVIRQLMTKNRFPLLLPVAKLTGVCEIIAPYVCTAINTGHTKLHMAIKRNEIRDTIIALLFLMKNGIHCDGYVLLPKISQLVSLLPSETRLGKMFQCKSKMITETENKYKMKIRLLSPTKLSQISFLVHSEEVCIQNRVAQAMLYSH